MHWLLETLQKHGIVGPKGDRNPPEYSLGLVTSKRNAEHFVKTSPQRILPGQLEVKQEPSDDKGTWVH